MRVLLYPEGKHPPRQKKAGWGTHFRDFLLTPTGWATRRLHLNIRALIDLTSATPHICRRQAIAGQPRGCGSIRQGARTMVCFGQSKEDSGRQASRKGPEVKC